ncbi:Outer membrane protein (porin) [Roseateles sp. YR242]|uniref:porin n=1 Tax=Roseateles sp. YR242 TaxID=1855305 RepID=UPI0008B0C602|nr:porin [Roseateles sp. YR242]SEL92052.1 Outer membrane protein (porin) [Roseateles sp. YR242]
MTASTTTSTTKNTHRRLAAFTSIGLASAMALSPALAQTEVSGGSSSVQLYGLIGIYADSLQRSDMTSSLKQVGSGGLTTSYWGIRGKDDLGDGTSAVFALESFFQPDNGGLGRSTKDGGWARNAYVGLSNTRLGAVTLGRQTNPTYTAMQLVNPYGSSVVFSPLVLQTFVATYGGAIVGDTVWDNTIKYQSPKVAGVSGSLIYGVGEVAGQGGINNLGAHLVYDKDGFTAVLSMQRNRTAIVAPATEQYAYLGGVAYDASWAKFYGAVARVHNEGTDLTARTWSLGTSVPVTLQGAILFDWAQTKSDTAGLAKTTRDTATAGYDYTLSKRTNIYAIYSWDKLTGHDGGNTYGVGIRHTF